MRDTLRDDGTPRLLSLEELARAGDGRASGERPSRLRRSRPSIDPSAAALGGKGARLVWLARHGFLVPEARLVPADVFDAVARDVLPPGHDVRSLLRLAGTREGIERAGKAHARLREARLPHWLDAELARIWAELAPHAPWGIAVRSSATCEDMSTTSLAGLATTRLGVRGHDEIADALREVWASLVLPRALAYLGERGVGNASMAVILQLVVPAVASAVATTSEPPIVTAGGAAVAGAPPQPARSVELLVNATSGLGAPVVSGVATPDVLRLRIQVLREDDPQPPEELRVLDQTIAHKSRALVVGPSGPIGTDVAESKRDKPALTQKNVEDLAEACGRLVTLGPGPWEVELAIDEGQRLWMLQARPVIEGGAPEGGDEQTVWSCANLAEALPGVATPLTWSVAASFSELGFRRAFASLGAVVPRGVKLVANVHGRFYLNLTAFMRVAATVPGLDPATLLELGGGEAIDLLQSQVQDVSTKGFYARLPFTAARVVREQARLDAELASYERDASRARAAFEALDLGILTDDGVATTIRDLQRFLDRTGSVMLSCASNALGSFVALRALLARWVDPNAATQLAGDLTAGGAGKGLGDLESARPTIALARIAEIALKDQAARDALLAEPHEIDAVPRGPTREALDRWIVAYGDRAIREPELSTPRWREDASFPLATLALYVRRGMEGRSFSPHTDEVGARADAAMRLVEAKVGVVQRTALRHLVARCHKFARLRERMRAWVTWVLGAIRVAALEAERRLRRREPALERPGEIPAVFFCTVDEILAVLRGESRAIARVVELRRAEHARDLARPDPETTFIGRPSPVRLEALGGPLLQGHGAAPGVVRGPARVLGSPTEAARLKPGEILVTRTTDVGWTPLFLAAAGVVTELGGPLSHAAIVARELGVPCVVNANGATMRIRDGDVVRLDGHRGVVEIEPAARPEAAPALEAP
ncbi:MAG: phosphoenolpyruvate synthase [Deltaproteobacteria bacterium]|nr:phosphoenolpyruvate synthase [Deltaproteobacteria bacterium]